MQHVCSLFCWNQRSQSRGVLEQPWTYHGKGQTFRRQVLATLLSFSFQRLMTQCCGKDLCSLSLYISLSLSLLFPSAKCPSLGPLQVWTLVAVRGPLDSGLKPCNIGWGFQQVALVRGSRKHKLWCPSDTFSMLRQPPWDLDDRQTGGFQLNAKAHRVDRDRRRRELSKHLGC